MDDRPDTLRLLHTSDWHLGHTLNEYERDREHAAFLAKPAFTTWQRLADSKNEIIAVLDEEDRILGEPTGRWTQVPCAVWCSPSRSVTQSCGEPCRTLAFRCLAC